MKYFFLLFGLFLLVKQCETIYFDKPQPDAVKNLKQLPKAYQGIYMDEDSTYLEIDKTSFIHKRQLEWKLTKSELDTSTMYRLDKNFLINTQTLEKIPVQFKHDTIHVFDEITDTLFTFSKDQLARSFKGNLILSSRQDDDLWEVEMYSLKDGILKYMAFYNNKGIFTDFAAMSDSEVIKDSAQTDTVKMILKPSKKEFKKILAKKDSLLVGEFRKISQAK
jgi:hypothetical protein